MSEEIPEATSASMIMVRVGGRDYPAKRVRQCRTCRSKYRPVIEAAISSGLTYEEIHRRTVEPYEDHSLLGPPDFKQIQRHVANGHMPLPHTAQRRIVEKRAEELGRSIEVGEDVLVDNVTAIRSIIQMGFERLQTGELAPNMRDLMQALQLQAQIDKEHGEGGLDEEVWRDALIAYMSIVRDVISVEQTEEIKRRMASSPVLKAIAERRNQAAGSLGP